jgi:NAD(P)-dependent dehydrogenase (short-subunit alcohol dehydrogenase family)
MRKVALITGSAKRIGREIAYHLARSGWDLALHYNQSYESVSQLEQQLKKNFPDQDFCVFRTDLASYAEIETLIPNVLHKFERINLLINNASVFEPSNLVSTSHEFLNHQMQINLYSPVILMRDFARYVGKGLVINLTDTRIAFNSSNYFAYTLSKKALWEATKMAAIELAPDVRVNAIAPGAIFPPEGKDVGYLLEIARSTPMKTITGIKPILGSIDYIIGNENLTGQMIFCDGGANLL